MGCFQFLVIVTKAAMKFGYKSFCGHSLFFFFQYTQEWNSLSLGRCILTLYEIAKQFSKTVAPFKPLEHAISPNQAWPRQAWIKTNLKMPFGFASNIQWTILKKTVVGTVPEAIRCLVSPPHRSQRSPGVRRSPPPRRVNSHSSAYQLAVRRWTVKSIHLHLHVKGCQAF